MIWADDFPFIQSVNFKLENQYRGQGFYLNDALSVILPIGSNYNADDVQNFDEGELRAVVTAVYYSIKDNAVDIELSLANTEDDGSDELALTYLLNPKHGWVQGDVTQ